MKFQRKSKVHIIKLDVYNQCEIGIFVGDTMKDAMQLAEKMYNRLDMSKHYGDNGHAAKIVHEEMGVTKFCIFLTKESTVSVMAHESLHLSWFFLEHIGIEVTEENHEALAYLQEYIFDCILKIFNKHYKVTFYE